MANDALADARKLAEAVRATHGKSKGDGAALTALAEAVLLLVEEGERREPRRAEVDREPAQIAEDVVRGLRTLLAGGDLQVTRTYPFEGARFKASKVTLMPHANGLNITYMHGFGETGIDAVADLLDKLSRGPDEERRGTR